MHEQRGRRDRERGEGEGEGDYRRSVGVVSVEGWGWSVKDQESIWCRDELWRPKGGRVRAARRGFVRDGKGQGAELMGRYTLHGAALDVGRGCGEVMWGW